MTLVLGLTACGGGVGSVAAKPTWRMPVETQTVSDRVVATEVRAGGTLDPADIVQISTRVPGVVERVRFNAGDVVHAGQVLIEIEPQRYRLATERAAAAVQKAEAQSIEAAASLARREQLAAEKLITNEELAGFRSRAAQAAADLGLAQAGLAQAELDARDADVRAPIDGILESRSVSSGQFLAVGSVIATQVQRLPLRLKARVTTAQAALLSVGQGVRVVPSSGGELIGHLVLVGAAADAASRTVTVVAEVSDADPRVVAGDFAEMIATASDGRSRPAIPQAALRATDLGYIAYVAEKDHDRYVARARVVKAGLRSQDGWMEVLGGLVAGDALITVGADGLRDGLPIEPHQVDTQASAATSADAARPTPPAAAAPAR